MSASAVGGFEQLEQAAPATSAAMNMRVITTGMAGVRHKCALRPVQANMHNTFLPPEQVNRR